MRKRTIQSINLKLSDLKEYDAVKQERAAIRAQNPDNKTAEKIVIPPPPLARVGPKTKQEILERIGLAD